MADGFVCDGCGATLLADSDVRYIVEMRGYAAYDPLEITRDDLERRDLDAEIAGALAAADERSAEELESDVHKEFRIDLCPRCWREWIRSPLRVTGRSDEPGGAESDAAPG